MAVLHLLPALPAIVLLSLLPLSLAFALLSLLVPRPSPSHENRLSFLPTLEEPKPTFLRPLSFASRQSGTLSSGKVNRILYPALSGGFAFGLGAAFDLAAQASLESAGGGLSRISGVLSVLGVFLSGLALILILTPRALAHVFPSSATSGRARPSPAPRTPSSATFTGKLSRSRSRIALLSLVLCLSCIFNLVDQQLSPSISVPLAVTVLAPILLIMALVLPIPYLFLLTPHRPTFGFLVGAQCIGALAPAFSLARAIIRSDDVRWNALNVAQAVCQIVWVGGLIICTFALSITPQPAPTPIPTFYPGPQLAILTATTGSSASAQVCTCGSKPRHSSISITRLASPSPLGARVVSPRSSTPISPLSRMFPSRNSRPPPARPDTGSTTDVIDISQENNRFTSENEKTEAETDPAILLLQTAIAHSLSSPRVSARASPTPSSRSPAPTVRGPYPYVAPSSPAAADFTLGLPCSPSAPASEFLQPPPLTKSSSSASRLSPSFNRLRPSSRNHAGTPDSRLSQVSASPAASARTSASLAAAEMGYCDGRRCSCETYSAPGRGGTFGSISWLGDVRTSLEEPTPENEREGRTAMELERDVRASI